MTIQDHLAQRDTIAAVATALGAGAVSVIRVSGTGAQEVRDRVFRLRRAQRYRPAVLHLGDVLAGEQIVDEALCAWFPQQNSYTGEVCVELHIHGGVLNTRRVLATVLKAGARLAQPGEFTMRAYLNGRMDLCQAEAVQQVVAATSNAELTLAQRALHGATGEAIAPLKQELTDILAELEARLDFPEEDLAPEVMAEVAQRTGRLRQTILRQRATASSAAKLCERPRVVLVGAPNAGKSTLLNTLCQSDRAITHPRAGTTRDVLEASLALGEVEVVLVDTAGLRASDDDIEREAVERSKKALQQADVRIVVVDVSRPLSRDDQAVLSEVGASATGSSWSCLVVANKVDLGVEPQARAVLSKDALEVSALTGEGIAELTVRLADLASPAADSLDSGWLVTVERHAQQLDLCAKFLQQALAAAAAGIAEEVVALELRQALHALVAIVGGDVTEDVLSSIFSRFCMGK